MDSPVSTADSHTRERPPLEWCVEEGLLDYDEALVAMQSRAEAIRAGAAPEKIWLVEHPPLYTAGTSARDEDLIANQAAPGAFPTRHTGRGGQWTYHGPGQRVAYTMLDLTRRHGAIPPRDIRAFVHGLEEWIIRALDRFNIRGERRTGRVGIWVVDPATSAEAKIAAIGVRVSRWVSWHGIALNVDPNLAHFAGIVPCGIANHGVTSLTALGLPVTMQDADVALAAAWQELFDSPSPA